VLLCDPAALELLGLDESQPGKTSYDADWNIIREDGTAFEAESRPMARVLATGGGVRNVVMGVYRPKTKDRAWLLVNAEPERDAEGRIVQIVATLIDITDRKRLESSLLEARKLESIGRLAGGIAHDFNNLLAVITTATSLAIDRLPPGSPAREELEVSLDAARRAAALTRQLLVFARKSPASPGVADVKALVDGMTTLLAHVVGSHIALQVDCASTWSTRLAPVESE
jgi:signal transduction histidine kinase